jgi:hypothetical protein
LLLLENQLPFFVLEKLYKFAGFSDSSRSCNHHEEGKPVEKHKENLKTRDAPIVKLFRNYFTYYDQKRKSICEEVIEGSTDEEVTTERSSIRVHAQEETEDPIGEEVTEVPTEGSSIRVRAQEETEDPIGEEVTEVPTEGSSIRDRAQEETEDPIGEEVTEVPTERSSIRVRAQAEIEDPIGEEVKHFTDMVRYLFCPKDMEQHWKGKMEPWSLEGRSQVSCKKNKRRNIGTHFCATKLENAGLKFKVLKDHNKRLLDIGLPGCPDRDPCFVFSCLTACLPCLICLICFPSLTGSLRRFGPPMHIFEFPQLVIDCNTEAMFRNLMALEQCHYPSKTYICSYVWLLSRLIDTKEDVDLLVDKKVIAHHLGSNAELVSLINNLGDQIGPTTSFYFNHIAQKVNEHYEFPLNHFLATLKREYFPDAFRGTATIVGLIVGLIVLNFTLLNTITPFFEGT